MIRFATLDTEQHYEAFKRGYDAQIALRSGGRLASVVPLQYLRAASHPTGCFNRRGEMVAGWVVQQHEPLIALAAMPQAERQAFLAATAREQLCELTAIWRNDGISANLFAALVWPKIIFDCVARRRACILGIGYENRMNEIYSRVRPRLIYQGPSQTLKDTDVYVYGYTPGALCATFASNLLARKLIPAARHVAHQARAFIAGRAG